MKNKIIGALSIILSCTVALIISLVVFTASNRSPNGLRINDNLALSTAQNAAAKAQKEKVFAEEAVAAFEADAKKFTGTGFCSIEGIRGAKYSSDYQDRLVYAARFGQVVCTSANKLATEAAAVAKDHVTFKSNTSAVADAALATAKSNHVAAVAKIASLEKATAILEYALVAAGLLAAGLIASIILNRKKN